MLAAAKENDVKLMTAHTQRYYPAVRAMKGVVDSGDLGSVIMAYDVWHKPYSPYGRPEWMLDRSRGGGMGQMDGSHQIDRLLWIIGYDVATVSAQQGQFTHPKSDHPAIDCISSAGRAVSSPASPALLGTGVRRNMAATGSSPTAWRGSDYRMAAEKLRRFTSPTLAKPLGEKKKCRNAIVCWTSSPSLSSRWNAATMTPRYRKFTV